MQHRILGHRTGCATCPTDRLGVDAIDPYPFHRPTPPYWWEEYGSCSTRASSSVGISGVGIAQLDVAREIALVPGVIPIPGASRSASIRASTVDLGLTADQFALPSV